MDRSLASPAARWQSRTPPPAAGLHHIARALAAAWHRLTMGADETYLRGAHDLVDLERRLKALERSGTAGTPPHDLWR